MFSKFIFPLLLSALTVTVTMPVMASAHPREQVCPPEADVAPCVCGVFLDGPSFFCEGPSTTQSTIDNLFHLFRSINNITAPSARLYVRTLLISNTSLTSLDLTFLARTDLLYLYIQENPNLTNFVGATNSTDETEIFPFQFRVIDLSLQKNGLRGGTGVGEFLRFVGAETLKLLFLGGNQIGQNGGHETVLRMLNRFANLEEFFFSNNQIEMLDGGDDDDGDGGYFKNNLRLTQIDFRLNKIQWVGPQTFSMNEPPQSMIGQTLFVYLGGNGLTEDQFQSENGLNSTGRPVNIFFEDNSFEFLAQETFESFLRADSHNYLYFHRNIFVCDERMRWLRDAKAEFETRVLAIDCTNDPGETIFTTSLLS